MPSTFTLHSNDLGGVVRQPQRHFSVGGGNRSPQLSWTNPPEGTKSFAVTIHDPDAPTGSGFWHWLAVNLPSSVRELPSGAGDPALGLMPEQAVQIRNDAGFAGYSGASRPRATDGTCTWSRCTRWTRISCPWRKTPRPPR